jgi:hypothetical protein
MSYVFRRTADVLADSDAAIISEITAILNLVGSPTGGISLQTAQLYLAELQRRNIRRLEKSSRCLEGLTVGLIILTIALLIVALPPAIEAV